jgi:N-dimethylarginine dimethylaminohydrolase
MSSPGNKSSKSPNNTFGMAAFGGEGWSPRRRTHQQEIGEIWSSCGIDNEWAPLKAVLLHRPEAEIAPSGQDHNAIQMLAPVDPARAGDEHDAMAQAYRDHNVEVHYVDPEGTPSPNQMFCADLFVMTPQGAILARPASTVRAGEERWIARRLADLGIPVLRTLTGTSVFEGADLMWLDPKCVMVGRGLRTNQAAVEQVTTLLAETCVETIVVDLAFGTMHFMGVLRIVDKDLALARPYRTPHVTVRAALDRGYKVVFMSDEAEADRNHPFNTVTLGPRKIMMVDGNPNAQAFYESLDIECVTVAAGELCKAAGAIGCLTGVLERELI